MHGSEPAKPPKAPIVLAIMMILVGVGWLLTAQGIVPRVNWIWTLGLAAVGLATFIVSGGLDKVSLVIGPFFLAASLLSVLRQTGRLSESSEVPILVILVGVLLLVAQAAWIPIPAWLTPLPSNREPRK